MGDDEEWTVYWIDTSVIIDRVMNMKRYQVSKIETHSSKYNEGLSVCIRIPYQIVQFFHIPYSPENTPPSNVSPPRFNSK